MTDTEAGESERKTYYVAVGARQILEDQEAAAFEFAIRANEEELDKLQELFEESQDADEDEAFSFRGLPTVSDVPHNDTYDALIKEIYHMLHKLGTHETKLHIESMNVLQ
jgi:DNA-binding FadR family transcriptional regulator